MKTLLFALSLSAWAPLSAQMSIALDPSVASPAPLGTVVTWTATVSSANPGTLWYRFRTRSVIPGFRPKVISRNFLPLMAASPATFRTVVDYGPNSSLNWSTIDQEGVFEIEVSVKNRDTGDSASTSALFATTSLSTDSPSIMPTANPLVFIYSAPSYLPGSRMSVQFQSLDGSVQNTPYKSCSAASSMNFYLAGLHASMQYTAQHVIDDGYSTVTGPLLTFNTPPISLQPPSVATLSSGQMPSTDGILLQSLLQTNAIATDLYGNIVWYGPDGISFLTRPQAGGTFLGIVEDAMQDASHQIVREFDLAWNTVAETNAGRVNEQLAALGLHPINAFHHEARKLPDGKYLVLANS